MKIMEFFRAHPINAELQSAKFNGNLEREVLFNAGDFDAQRQRYAGRGINQEWLIAPERWSKMAPPGGMTTGALKSMKSELKSIANGSVFHERSCWAPTLNAGNVERRLPLVRLNSNLRLRSTFFHRLQSVVSWLALG